MGMAMAKRVDRSLLGILWDIVRIQANKAKYRSRQRHKTVEDRKGRR